MARYLITGATRGIGRATLERLAADGHDLIAVGRDAAALAALPVAERLVLDLADASLLAGLVPAFDRLDGVVHSAGLIQRATTEQADVDLWRQHLELNVIAVAELTRLLLPALRRGRGSVVLVNSGQGQNASAGNGPYAASKFALRAFADALRAEEPELRVTTLYPGRVATDMQRDLRAQEGGAYEPERYIQPGTVAGVITQLLATPADATLTEVVIRPPN